MTQWSKTALRKEDNILILLITTWTLNDIHLFIFIL